MALICMHEGHIPRFRLLLGLAILPALVFFYTLAAPTGIPPKFNALLSNNSISKIVADEKYVLLKFMICQNIVNYKHRLRILCIYRGSSAL